MRPGNNYRAAASCLADALTQVGQTDADTLSVRFDVPTQRYVQNGWFDGYKVPVVWSEMLTVWRKLHVDSMVRPAFAQNTFTMNWNEPEEGGVSTQIRFDVDDPWWNPFQTDNDQFMSGYVELQDTSGTPMLVSRVVAYGNYEGGDDWVLVNVPDCGGGQSGLACLGGVEEGTATLSDDDLSIEATFTAKVWGCDVLYAGGGAALLPPNLGALELPYQPAYIHPVHETAVSGAGGVGTFLRNVNFDSLVETSFSAKSPPLAIAPGPFSEAVLGSYERINFDDNDGKILWDQVLPIRALPVSTSDYWTVMVVSAWQAEEAEDADPNSEIGTTPGVTKGINTHKENPITQDTPTTSSISPAPTYTGIAAVFRGVFGEAGFSPLEHYTVAHEIGHTFGLDHPDGGLMCSSGDCQTEPFTATSLKKLRDYVHP